MSALPFVLAQYDAAILEYGEACAGSPDVWHQPDSAAFSALRQDLLPYAERGEISAQYAVATIHSMGLCSESEDAYLASRPALLQEATRWWIAAAMQGHSPSLDNLITDGLGAEAERARAISRLLELERPDLVSSAGEPCFGRRFMEEVTRRFSEIAR